MAADEGGGMNPLFVIVTSSIQPEGVNRLPGQTLLSNRGVSYFRIMGFFASEPHRMEMGTDSIGLVYLQTNQTWVPVAAVWNGPGTRARSHLTRGGSDGSPNRLMQEGAGPSRARPARP